MVKPYSHFLSPFQWNYDLLLRVVLPSLKYAVMKYFLFPAFIILSTIISHAQTPEADSLAGSWRGVITQNEGGYASEYQFELFLIKEGNKITGRSYVKLEEIYATMELKGELIGPTTLSFQEVKIVDETSREGMEWCFKQGFLIFKNENGLYKLEGPWSGKTKQESPCIPGDIVLERVSPRA
jgi:hypothetical protein